MSRGFVIQGAEITSPIVPGTFAIGASDSGILSVSYTENLFTLDPSTRFLHQWAATSGKVTISDAGGGALRLRVTNAAMEPGTVIPAGTGTVTLNIDGMITSVM